MNRFILSYIFFIGLIFGIGKSESHLQIKNIYTIDKNYYNVSNQLGVISEINDSSITFVWNGFSILGKRMVIPTTLLFQNIDRIVFEPMFYEEAPLLLFCAAIPASAFITLIARSDLPIANWDTRNSPAWFLLPIIPTISYFNFKRKIINAKTINMNDWDLSNKKLFFKNIFSIHNDIYMNKYLKNKYLNDLLLGYKN